jgi:hypothetical protein
MRKLALNSVTVKILDSADALSAVVGGAPRRPPNPNPRPSRESLCLPSITCTASPE